MRALLLLAGCCSASAAFAQAPPPAANADLPVLARNVEKGDIVSAADFVLASRPAGEGRSALSPDQAAGKEAVRSLQEGTTVRSFDLIRPQWVHRGEPVTIAVRSGALSITAQGKALASGARGESVRVVNLATNRTLDAVVDAPGIVRIAAP
ncbi:MAG: flgA [Alphaproteobacteria bacterium]|nr:flgA [Alphaproteobacteria bacterium]